MLKRNTVWNICNIFICFCLLIIAYVCTINLKNQQYCNLQNCESRPHSLCIYSNQPSIKCGQCYQVGLTSSEKKEILNYHNKLRRKVAAGLEENGSPGPQPPAVPGSMLNMIWSHELTTIAQRWANQCILGHDECRNTPLMNVGQNAAYEANSRPEDIKITNFVQRWYDEVKLFDKNFVKEYQSSSGTGHYTQLVWGKSKLLGCGYVKCIKEDELHYAYLICNYGPAGNFIGDPIYETKD